MKIAVASKFLTVPPERILQTCGYLPIFDRLSQQESWSRRMGSGHYPRFHIYLERDEKDVILNIHLDQKQASYDGSSRHSGEYESEVVEQEAERIKAVVLSFVKK